MNNNIEELKKLPFEKALEQLEQTVGMMESGNLPLDQMISCFEQGNALKNICSHKLNDLEKKIEVLVKEDNQGGEWQEFDVENPREGSALSPAPEVTPQVAPTQPQVAQVQQQVVAPQPQVTQQQVSTPVEQNSRPVPDSNDMLF